MKSGKPVSVVEQPREKSDREIQADAEAAEKRASEIREAKLKKSDALSALLNAEGTYFITDSPIPEAEINNRRVFVSRFYPVLKIAVDFFYSKAEQNQAMPELRKNIITGLGIKYAWVGPDNGGLSDILDQLAGQ